MLIALRVQDRLRINRTLKETLTKLALEIGSEWVTFLPYVLFSLRNSSYQMGLTLFEIMYSLPPPLAPSLQDEMVLPTEEVNLLGSLKALSQIQADIWPQLRALYSSHSLSEPHSFQPGN